MLKTLSLKWPAGHLWLIMLLALFLGGCAAHPEKASSPAVRPPEIEKNVLARERMAIDRQKLLEEQQVSAMDETSPVCGECPGIDNDGQRDSCYKLRPGRKVAYTKIVKGKNGKKKKVAGTRTSRCQPQSLIYARCRTGIDTCRLGDTSPVQWFACARKNGSTSSVPKAGSILILAGNSGRRMPTGHPAYVEEACVNKDGTWTLRLSHTNYDRRCHLDLDAQVVYCPKNRTARFVTGPWSSWANQLKVLGFITG